MCGSFDPKSILTLATALGSLCLAVPAGVSAPSGSPAGTHPGGAACAGSGRFGFLIRPIGAVMSATDLDFRLIETAAVSLSLYDLQGRQVRVLFRRQLAAGVYLLTWDGRDDARKRALGGVYVARLRCGKRVAAKKVILAR